MLTGERLPVATALAALGAIALGAGLEGGYEHRMGALALSFAAIALLLALVPREMPRLSRPGAGVALVLLAVLALQLLPMPPGLRHLLAPGQAERLDHLAGVVALDRDAWLSQMTAFDLDVLFGKAPTWSVDILAGTADPAWRIGAISPSALYWQAGQWGIYASLLLVGWRIAKSRPAILVFLVGMLMLCLGEALFGLANRNGPSTGLSRKVAYLGSATGTFINRGHFGAFLAFGIGSAWGLAASLFPLLPDEVRRHASRKRRSSQPPGVLEASGDKVPRLSLLAFATGLLFVAMVASTSRGPLLSVLCAALAIGVWTRIRRGDAVHLGLGLGVPAVGVVLAVVTAGPFGALARFMALGRDDASLIGREGYWEASFAALREAPIFGAGIGAWALAVAPHEVVPHLYAAVHAHSEPIEILVEVGVVGALAVLAAVVLFGRAVLARIDVVEHDLSSSVAVGALLPLLAIALQSLGDFPLRTPGVAIPFAIFAGLALGGLGIGEQTGRRWPVTLLAAGALSAVLACGWADLKTPGPRSTRLNEAAPALLLRPVTTDEEAVQGMERACAGASAEPFDAWWHVACAIAASRVASREDSASAAFTADVAATRALSLHPDDPRMLVQMANVWLRLRGATGLRDALSERATVALAAAVGFDGWRAEDAFKLARGISPEAVDRIGAAAADEGVSRARTLYQYGIVLEEEGRKADARRVAEEAARVDPQYGPPFFRAGVLARQEDDAVAARSFFEGFLKARDRPVGMEGWVLFYLGEAAAAEVRFRRAVAVEAKNRWAWEGLAFVAREEGDEAGEAEAWMRVLGLTPDHPLAVERLRVLGRIE